MPLNPPRHPDLHTRYRVELVIDTASIFSPGIDDKKWLLAMLEHDRDSALTMIWVDIKKES